MLAQGVHEARAAILSLTARNKALEEALRRLRQWFDGFECGGGCCDEELELIDAALNHQDAKHG
jgi:hypothetical protein